MGKSKRMEIGANDGETVMSKRNRSMLSLVKPSYLLALGPTSKSFRCEHRERLCKILQELVRQLNWREASGVLSVLMQGTKGEKSPELNRLKYPVCIEILKHIQSDDANSSRIDHIYDTWSSRTSSTKDGPIEARSLVYLEQILHFLTEGNNEDASQAVTSLIQHREYGNDLLSYMVIGLTFYELWYCKFLKGMQWKDLDHTPSQSEMSGSRSDYPIALSVGHDIAYSQETEASFKCESETSVMNDKKISHKSNNGSEDMSMAIDTKENRNNISQLRQPVQVYATSDEIQGSLQNDVGPTFDASLISVLEGMDSWLFPLKLPQDHDYHVQMLNDSNYKEAVKYLRLALHSMPPNLAALRPLVQLLLIGGQVDYAMNEVEEVCKNSNAAPPFRMRACLLETFNPYSNMLSNYYEDALKKDPACSHLMVKLLNVHQSGDYSLKSLVEMIALHLEATSGEPNIWKEFALCFLNLSSCDEERMSVCPNRDGEKQSQSFSVCFNKTPKIFTDGTSGKVWKARCRCWLRRHFRDEILSSEIIKGDLQLLTYKAACAAHMYGRDFDYVVNVVSLLENDSDGDWLRTHRQNSICIYPSFVQ